MVLVINQRNLGRKKRKSQIKLYWICEKETTFEQGNRRVVYLYSIENYVASFLDDVAPLPQILSYLTVLKPHLGERFLHGIVWLHEINVIMYINGQNILFFV